MTTQRRQQGGFLDSLVADLENAGVVTPRQAPGAGPSMEPQAGPTPTPPTPTPGGSGFDFGLPGGGGGGGYTAPTGGGGDGTISPPGGPSTRHGEQTHGGVPDNFERFPFYGGYFYDPSSGIIGYMKQTGTDYLNQPTFGFVKLTQKEKATFLNNANTEHPELFNGESNLLPGGAPTAYDPAGMANVAVRQQELAEQIRHQRMQEAQAAADAAQARFQSMMQARLEGAKYAVTPSMAASGYFPGLSPTSALVRAGVADPLSFQPSYFNPASINTGPSGDTIARDLAAIRGAANG